jgi:hypothetical protein
MANTLPTIDDITLAALDVFENSLYAVKCCSRKLEDSFGNKGGQIGDSVRIRKPAQFSIRSGQAWSGEDIEEQTDTLTLDKQKGVDFSMTSKERKLDLDSLTRQVLKPAIVRLANEVDADVLQDISQSTFNLVGTAGSTPSTMQSYIDAGAKLSDSACPRGNGERFLFVNPEMEGDIAYALRDYFHRGAKISGIFDSAEMGMYAAGHNWMMDQNVYRHTVGTYSGTPLVNGASQSGASLITNGWGSGASNLTVGDRFTIANVNAVNPVTKSALSSAQQFVVTTAISDTAGAMTITISPSIVGPGQRFQNVDALPANDAAITVVGTTGLVYSQGVSFNEEAVALAIVPLEKPKGVNQASMKYDAQSGVGLRYIEWYDGDSDLWKSRFDVLYGIQTQRPEWSCVIAAA